MTTAERAEAPPEASFPQLPYAGPGIRIVAGILDLIVVASILMLFVAAAGLLLLLSTDWGDSDISDADAYPAVVVMISYLVVLPWYFIAMWWWRGQSVGMMAVHIAVTDRDGGHVPLWRALVRTVTWPLSIIPLGLGLVPMFFDGERRALHDMLAGTVVVDLP